MEDGEFDDNGPGWEKYPEIKAQLNPVIADDGIFCMLCFVLFCDLQTTRYCNCRLEKNVSQMTWSPRLLKRIAKGSPIRSSFV